MPGFGAGVTNGVPAATGAGVASDGGAPGAREEPRDDGAATRDGGALPRDGGAARRVAAAATRDGGAAEVGSDTGGGALIEAGRGADERPRWTSGSHWSKGAGASKMVIVEIAHERAEARAGDRREELCADVPWTRGAIFVGRVADALAADALALRSPTMDATGMDVDAPYAAAEPSDATTADGAPIAGQIKELQNSIAHLLRSNKEMEEIIAESGPDKELRDAIGENIVVIARRKAILADLLKLLAETDPSQPAAAAATAAPPLTADGSTADAGVYL